MGLRGASFAKSTGAGRGIAGRESLGVDTVRIMNVSTMAVKLKWWRGGFVKVISAWGLVLGVEGSRLRG